MAKKELKDKNEIKGRTPEEVMKASLDASKSSHGNYTADVEANKISTGSLTLDYECGGGIRSSGLVRLVGFTEGGKSSESLEIIRNFLKSVDNSRGLYIKAEGRFAPEMIERCGLNFVKDPTDWKPGTVLLLDTQDYDFVIQTMRDLVMDNPTNCRYVFVLDSMDALRLRSDIEKNITDPRKVAGAASLTKEFLKALAAAMNKFGHLCIMIGQVSSKIEIDDGGKEVRQISATGGNAALHWSNWILQFEPRFNSDRIMDDPKKPYDAEKNKLYGHWCKVKIMKSPNETTGKVVKYPIKYGRKGGSSIWREYEIVDMLTVFGQVELKGAGWYTVNPELLAEVKEKTGIDMTAKHQGTDNFCDYLEENAPITDYLFNKLLGMLTASPSI